MKRLTTTILFSTFLVFHAFADWKIVISTKSIDGQEEESTFYAKNGVLKQATPEMDVIIDLNSRNITFSNHPTKTYWQGSIEDFDKELEELMKMMMIEMLGEEAYEEMEKMEQEDEGQSENERSYDIEIMAEDETVDIAGYKGTKHTVIVDGELTEELWLCKEIDAFDDFNFDEMSKMFAQEGEGNYTDSEKYQALIKKSGFPIKEVTYSYGEVSETVKLVSAEQTTLPADMFEVPANFTKVNLLQAMGMGGN